MLWPLSTLSDFVVQLQGVNRFADVDIRIKVCPSPHPPRFNSTIALALHSLPSSINRRPLLFALCLLHPRNSIHTFSFSCRSQVTGGGKVAQIYAIRQAIAKSIVAYVACPARVVFTHPIGLFCPKAAP